MYTIIHNNNVLKRNVLDTSMFFILYIILEFLSLLSKEFFLILLN